ncbi:MAG: sulfite exporter TauE/SafE family protein [Chloroflexota bacterium]
MDPFQAVCIILAGMAAGAINTIVGSGSLVTFPTLLAFGYSPLVANVSNTLGLVPGSISGAIGYRRELVGQRDRAIRLGIVAGLGGLTGGLILLVLPASSFKAIVPFLILLACALMAVQPRLARAMAKRDRHGEGRPTELAIGIYLTGIYGGYFGAAQGVILLALLGIFLPDNLQRLNGLKNILAAVVNGVAAILFILFAPVNFLVAALIAIGSIVGGQVGAYVGRRLPPMALRAAVISVGIVAALALLLAPSNPPATTPAASPAATPAASAALDHAERQPRTERTWNRGVDVRFA